ncbi:6782_t:CDS:1 [Ambispora gerdemannii]|uniref:Protein phosphatase n=1 Tax=Ambispora gerdemannii TaxID=144530 RepID=A0A9N9GWR5_9GLOM|nr:6782_t:CDS:1 [Ambispora gerdemannii]
MAITAAEVFKNRLTQKVIIIILTLIITWGMPTWQFLTLLLIFAIFYTLHPSQVETQQGEPIAAAITQSQAQSRYQPRSELRPQLQLQPASTHTYISLAETRRQGVSLLPYLKNPEAPINNFIQGIQQAEKKKPRHSGFSIFAYFAVVGKYEEVRPWMLLPVGDDAFWRHECECASYSAVCDGVGGWRVKGVEASEFSWGLCDAFEKVAKKDGTGIPLSAKTVLSRGYYDYLNSDKLAQGSSTACLISINKANGRATTALIGDSQYAIIRGGTILYKSDPQVIAFNTPGQLSSELYLERCATITTKPKEAVAHHHQLAHQDIIIMGSDGLWDNLYDYTILSIIGDEIGCDGFGRLKKNEMEAKIQSISERLRNAAYEISNNPTACSPFSDESTRAGQPRCGGKYDDITVEVITLFDNSFNI